METIINAELEKKALQLAWEARKAAQMGDQDRARDLLDEMEGIYNELEKAAQGRQNGRLKNGR